MGRKVRSDGGVSKLTRENLLAKMIAGIVSSVDEVTFDKSGKGSLCNKIEILTKKKINSSKRIRYRNWWNKNASFRNAVKRLIQERSSKNKSDCDSSSSTYKSRSEKGGRSIKNLNNRNYAGKKQDERRNDTSADKKGSIACSETVTNDEVKADNYIDEDETNAYIENDDWHDIIDYHPYDVDAYECDDFETIQDDHCDSENEVSVSNASQNIRIENTNRNDIADDKKKTRFVVDIGLVQVVSNMFKDIDGEINKDKFRFTLEEILMYTFRSTCTLGFYGYRRNKMEAVIYAKCRRADHDQRFKFVANKIDTPYTTIVISSTEELLYKHKESSKMLYRTLKGEEREKVRQQLMYRSARDYQLDTIMRSSFEMAADGNSQEIRHLNVLHKIKSETKIRNRLQLQSNDLGDLIQYWIEQHKKADPYLRYVGLPFTVVMFTEKQFELVDTKNAVLHMDATGSIIRRPETLNCKKIFYYSIVKRFKESTIPLVEMITSEHHIASISTMLKRYKFFVMEHKYKWPYFRAIVVDWSWALINSVMFEWNEMSISTYLETMFEYSVNQIKPKGITIVVTCCAHFIKRVSRSIEEKYPEHESIKDFLLECVSIMLLCREITDLDETFEYFMRVLLTRNESRAEEYILYLAALKTDETEDLRNIEKEIDDEMIENTYPTNLECMEELSNSVYRNSPFFKYFHNQLELFKVQIGDEQDQIITNKYYAPEYASHIVHSYMAYVPMWSALCLDLIDKNISRISNAYVESYMRILKHEILESHSRNSAADVVRKCEEYVSKLVVEENMDIHTKSAIRKERRPKYPETASNPFVQEKWARAKENKKKKSSHIRGNVLKHFAKKLKENTLTKRKENITQQRTARKHKHISLMMRKIQRWKRNCFTRHRLK